MFASSGRILGVLGPVERDIELLVGRQRKYAKIKSLGLWLASDDYMHGSSSTSRCSRGTSGLLVTGPGPTGTVSKSNSGVA